MRSDFEGRRGSTGARSRVLLLAGSPLAAWQRLALEALGTVADVAQLGSAVPTPGVLPPHEYVVWLGGAGPGSGWPPAPVLVIRDEDGLGPEALGAGAILGGRQSVLVRLLRLVPGAGAATVLEEAALPLVPWNAAASRQRILNLVASWPARALAGTTQHVPRPAALPRSAATWRRTALRLAELRNFASAVKRAMLEAQWTIGIVDAPADALLDGSFPAGVRWLEPPADGFLADPMALPDEVGEPTILAEIYRFAGRRGQIVALAPGGGSPRLVLDRPWHLSYPLLLRHAGEIYCLPEMWEAGRVQLFRAAPFPDRWVEGPVLLDGIPAVDATLHHDGERYWLFCSNEHDEPETKLFLFHSRDLVQGWRPHPWNPVRCDRRNSRSAGPLFVARDSTWRPAQDCTSGYGKAVVLNRILELTPERFREEAVSRLVPPPGSPYPDGLHTFCAAGAVTLIDGRRDRMAPWRIIASARAFCRATLRQR